MSDTTSCTTLLLRLRPSTSEAPEVYPVEVTLDGAGTFSALISLAPAAFQALESSPWEYGRQLGQAVFTDTGLQRALAYARGKSECVSLSLQLDAPDLQDLLWGSRMHSVLVILQGRDSAGKDGAIKHVAGCLNPRGVHVTSFGVPTQEENEHDFLWRVHRQAPRKGEFAIFNRSHYEDVLVVRVHDLVPKSLWKERYDHIRDFEELLAERRLAATTE